ncbi:hypothetical protein ACS0PU_010393 [Formica fusca]
MPDVLRCDW